MASSNDINLGEKEEWTTHYSEKGAEFEVAHGEVKLLVASWNMGNAKATNLDVLIPNQGAGYDMIVLGCQESTYKAKKGITTLFMDASVAELRDSVEAAIGDEFYRAHYVKQVQMQLLIYARKEMRSRISNLEYSTENTGFFGVLPNKGGILGSMTVDGTSLAFVSCHLAAHEGVTKCAARNSSIVEILGGIRARDKRMDPSVQFHHTIWMGDMNYRTTFDPAVPNRNVCDSTSKLERRISNKTNKNVGGHTTTPAVVEEEEDKDGTEVISHERKEQFSQIYDLIEHEKWNELLKMDELNRELAAGRVLKGFTALQPSFPPTFKRSRDIAIPKFLGALSHGFHKKIELYKENANAELQASTYYHHKRLPSYTDRILHASLPGFSKMITATNFTSRELCLSSDHKPVCADFHIKTVRGKMGIRKATLRDHDSRITLTLSNLRGKDLAEMDPAALGGGSDPYIIVTADPHEIIKFSTSKFKSETIKHNLNPDWKDMKMEINLKTIDLDGLSCNAHLLVQVWDEDVVGVDDLIGTVTIPFSSIIKGCKQGATFSFDNDLLDRGLVQGKLLGSIKLDVPPQRYAPTLTTTFSSRSFTHHDPCSNCVIA
jgi:hypothetical protein